MNKKILIVVDGAENIGSVDDLNNYKNFFKSLGGGAWNEDEIFEIKNTNTRALFEKFEELSVDELDYFILIFSGHGGLYEETMRDTCLSLNAAGNEYVLDSSVINRCRKQLTILDCCRSGNVTHQELFSESVKAASVNWQLRSSVRNEYEQFISETRDGACVLYACERGDSTNGEDGQGGDFSCALLNKKGIFDWCSEGGIGKYSCVTIDKAFEYASVCLNMHGQQPVKNCESENLNKLPWLFLFN